MAVLTRAERQKIIDNLPEVEYPRKVIERLNREYKIAKAQMASGELKPMTVEELAAKHGITLD